MVVSFSYHQQCDVKFALPSHQHLVLPAYIFFLTFLQVCSGFNFHFPNGVYMVFFKLRGS